MRRRGCRRGTRTTLRCVGVLLSAILGFCVALLVPPGGLEERASIVDGRTLGQVRKRTVDRMGVGELLSPDVAVPAEFDQLFVCGLLLAVGGRLSRIARDDVGRVRGQTLEFIFAYVYGCWRIDDVGGEVVDHCGRHLLRWIDGRGPELLEDHADHLL